MFVLAYAINKLKLFMCKSLFINGCDNDLSLSTIYL